MAENKRLIWGYFNPYKWSYGGSLLISGRGPTLYVCLVACFLIYFLIYVLISIGSFLLSIHLLIHSFVQLLTH